MALPPPPVVAAPVRPLTPRQVLNSAVDSGVAQEPIARPSIAVPTEVPLAAERVVADFSDKKPAPALLNVDDVATDVIISPELTTPAQASDTGMPGSERSPVPHVRDVDADDFWHALVLDMVRAESVTALVRELALQSQLLARDASGQPPRWQLRVENATLKQAAVTDRLQNALALHGHVVVLAVEVGPVSDTPGRRVAEASRQRMQQAEQAVLNDPYVQHLMRDFGGKIVPGTLKPLDT